MKLVNVAERVRGVRKDIVQQISVLAPEILSSKNINCLVDKLYSVGLVHREEKTYFEMRLQAKLICLLMEKIFEEHGYDVCAALHLVDRDNSFKFGKLVNLSCPHVPAELVNLWDEQELRPFHGVSCRAVLTNKVVVCEDIESSPLYEETAPVLLKYGFKSAIAFPVHYDNGDSLGVLFLCSRQKLCIDNHAVEIIQTKIKDLEHVFTGLEQSWRNKDIIYFKGIMSAETMIMYVDPEVEEVLGFSPGEINGQLELRDFVHPDEWERIVRELLEPIKAMHSAKSIVRCLKRDGTYKPMEILTVPILDSNGTLRYYENHIIFNSDACKTLQHKLEKTAIH